MGKYTKRGGKYSRKRRHLGRNSKKGRGARSRLQAGGQPVFVGSPWSASDTNTWGSSNYYSLSPNGSGSGDPLDIILGTRNVNPSMAGGRRRRRKTRSKSKGKRKHVKRRTRKFYKGKKSKTHKGKDFTTRKRSKRYSEKRFKKLFGKKTVRAPVFPYLGGKRRKMKGGYMGDIMFQNGVNMLRSAGNDLGNVVRGFEGYPKGVSPMPVDQPGMEPEPRPISMPADVDNLYKSAQSQVGAIGSA